LGVIAGLLAVGDALCQTSLTVGNTPGFPGTTVSVPVSARRATNIVAAQFDVAFTPGKVASGDATLGTVFGQHVIQSREIAPGIRRVVVYSFSNATLQTNGFAATLPFQLSPQEHDSSGPLTPTNAILARRDATAIAPVQLNSGQVFARPVFLHPDGRAEFFLAAEADHRYVVQATTNFVDWRNISTNIATGEFLDLFDAEALFHPFRFYRWELADP
jgi:hypothetical protein